ncbi:MAG: RDD family protein [Bryobacteraceae bacterium]
MDAATTVPVQYCSECGQMWPPEELARFGDRLICPNCKNAYAQKLREGVVSTVTMQYGGFWIRFLAAIIDGAILLAVRMIVQMPASALLMSRRPEVVLTATGGLFLVQIVIGTLYEGLFVSRAGATPGKMALSLKVVRADGGPVSLGRACARYFAKMLSAIILMIGYIMAGFDEQKRALHDILCDTRVIRTGSL